MPTLIFSRVGACPPCSPRAGAHAVVVVVVVAVVVVVVVVVVMFAHSYSKNSHERAKGESFALLKSSLLNWTPLGELIVLPRPRSWTKGRGREKGERRGEVGKR